MTPELLRPLESLLNRNIAGSSRARGLLGQVAGRSMELRFSATPLRLRFVADAEKVTIVVGDEQPADAIIEGTPFALARLALGDPAQSIRAGGVALANAHGAGVIEADGVRPFVEAAIERLRPVQQSLPLLRDLRAPLAGVPAAPGAGVELEANLGTGDRPERSHLT